MQEGVELEEGELAVAAEQFEADGAQVDAGEGAGVGDLWWEGGAVGSGWAAGPVGGLGWPEAVVDVERAAEDVASLAHPLDGSAVEVVKGVDQPLALLVEALAFGEAQA